MTVYDAGSVRASAELNRDPFIEGLRQCQTEGNRFAAQRFTATAGMDTVQARRDLAALQLHMRQVAEETITVTARADVDKAIADLERLRAEQKRVDESVRASSTTRTKATKDETQQIGLLRTAIEFLGPEVIALGGGLLGLTAGAAVLGATGLVAFKGISTEIKQGTVLGGQFHGGLNVLQNDLSTIERTTSRGVLSGFDTSILSIQRNMPSVNALLSQSSVVLGDVTGHLVNGLLGGLSTFQPVILAAEHDLDGFAAYFDRWATGSGGAHFSDVLLADMKVAIPALEQLLKLVEHLLAAGNGPGMLLLGDLGLLAKALNSLPVGVLQTLLDTYLAFRAASVVSVILNNATVALKGFAVAETEAAAAGAVGGLGGAAGAAGSVGRLGGMAGSLAAGLAVAAPYAAAVVGVAFGIHLAADATKSWADSTSRLKQVIGGDLAIISSRPDHWASVFNNVTGRSSAADTAAANRRADKQTIDTYTGANLNQLLNDARSTLTSNGQNPYTQSAAARAIYTSSVNQIRYQLAQNLAAQNAYAAANVVQAPGEIASQQRNTFHNIDAQGWSSASSSLGVLGTSLRNAQSAEEKFLAVNDKNTFSINGTKVAYSTYDAVLQSVHGNVNKAIGILTDHVTALNLDKTAQDQVTQAQININGALDIAQTKYGLSAQQAQAFAAVMGITSADIGNGTVSLGQWSTALGTMVKDLVNAGPSMTNWMNAVVQFTSTADTAASRAALMGQAMVSLQGDNLGYANTMVEAAVADQRLITDFEKLHKGVLNLKTGHLDYHNAGAAPVLDDLAKLQQGAMNAAEATYQMESRTGNLKTAAKDASLVFRNDTYGALVSQAKQLDLTKTEAQKLADTYFKWPKDAQTQIELLGQDKVQNTLSGILADLDQLVGKHSGSLDFHATVSMSASDRLLLNQAENNATVRANISSANGNLISYYANGGMGEHHIAQITAPGSAIRVWNEPETMGEAYIPLNPAKRVRSQAIASETVHRLGGVAYFEQGGFSGTTTGSGSSSSSGGSGSVTATQMKSLLTTIENELRAMGALGRDTASQIASVENALTSAFNTAHLYGIIPSATVTALARDNAALTAEVKIRDSTAAALKTANTNLANELTKSATEARSIAGTALGAFDIGTSGNGYAYGISASLGSDITSLQKFTTLRDKAKALGLSPALIAQLTKEGPATAGANLQAIVGGGAAYVQKLNAQYAQFSSLSSTLGWSQAHDDNIAEITRLQAVQHADARAVAAAQARTNVLVAQLIALTKDLDAKAEARARQLGL